MSAIESIFSVIDAPVGPMTLVANEGALTGVYLENQARRPEEKFFGTRDDDWFSFIKEQFDEYFSGNLTTFNVPLNPKGTEFQHQVWAALREIPYGHTWTYGQLADHIGNPKAVRAVGLANGRNPISIIVPCHRVIGANGALTGYASGVERKKFLLDLEEGQDSLI